MYYKKLMLVVASALLGASFVQEASAWGTGGSVGTPRKSFANLVLWCDLSDPRSTLTIETTPSNAAPAARPSFKVSGRKVCAEVDITVHPNPSSLDQAIVFAAGPKAGEKAIGVFELVQITDPVLFPGMTYTGPTTAVDGTRTWSFDVTGHESFPSAEFSYELKPVVGDVAANAFCDPANLGVIAPPNLDPTNCKALFGLQGPPMAADYPAGRISNGITLSQGQVSTFSTITVGGVETPQPPAWAPCHTERFIGPLEPVVDALLHNSAMLTDGGTVVGLGLGVPGVDTGNPLFVSVRPNDLWNAGPIARWSNADGLIVDLFTTAFKAPVNNLDQLDPEVAAFCTANPAECPAGIPNKIGQNFGSGPFGDGHRAPYGTLVGRISDGYTPNYQNLGTLSTIQVSPLSELKLFYWDLSPPIDNTGSVKVSIATDSIQCIREGIPVPVAQAHITSSTAVEVVYQTELNVKNKSTKAEFPIHIVGCTSPTNPGATYNLDVQSDGSPIIGGGGTEVLINSIPVVPTDFHVGDKISRPSCDNGQTVLSGLGTPDFKFDFNQKTVIDTVFAPGGFCTNGVNSYKLEVHNLATDGWYSGTGTVVLSNCKTPI